jgi:hypothetical protein
MFPVWMSAMFSVAQMSAMFSVAQHTHRLWSVRENPELPDLTVAPFLGDRHRERISMYVEANKSGSVLHDRLASRCGSAPRSTDRGVIHGAASRGRSLHPD